MANYKHRLFKQYKSGNINFDVYNSYKNNLGHEIKNAKKTYFCKKFENCKNDSKKTWKTINSILSNKRKIESHIVLTVIMMKIFVTKTEARGLMERQSNKTKTHLRN